MRPHPGVAATDDEVAAEIDFISVEGRPAHPEHGGRQIVLAIAAFGVVVVLCALAVGLIFHNIIAGVGLALLGVLMCIVNPAVWAGVLRARERDRARRIIEGEEPEPPPRPE